MALTLAAGISASDRYCTVNQPPTQPPGSYYRIGDEVVQHIGFATPTPIWSQTFLQLYIARGQLGTTAASHLSGAALTYVRPEFLSATAETDPGPFETGGAGGGGVTVDNLTDPPMSVTTLIAPGAQISGSEATLLTTYLLGPYTVNWNDSNVGTDVHEVGPIDDGLLIVNGWMFPTTPWTHTGGAPVTSSFYITVHVASALGGGHEADLTVASYDGVQTFNSGAEPDPAGVGSVYKSVALTDATSTIGFQAYADAGTLTAGVADIYLLVAPLAV
jgi:hypothetical protein